MVIYAYPSTRVSSLRVGRVFDFLRSWEHRCSQSQIRTWLEYELDAHSTAFKKLLSFNEQSSASGLGDDPSIW